MWFFKCDPDRHVARPAPASPADQSSHPHSPVPRAAAPVQALTTPIIMTPYNAIRLMTVNHNVIEPNILSSSGKGQGPSQMRVKKAWVRLLGPAQRTQAHDHFSWLLKGLDKSDQSRMGQYSQVDYKAEIKWDYRGGIREYFNESKIFWVRYSQRSTV